MNKRLWCFLIYCLFLPLFSYAQEAPDQFIDSSSTPISEAEVDIFQISLEEILNKPIVLASQKTEKVMQSPLSATVITKEEILRAGSTSIPEALRLAPGLIVREQTNGNYDIHIRGLDNLPPSGNDPTFSTNTITLVMINNRPVYNFFQGGTFWETLPVDLADVERIEIVRGPASALYGTNAVQGVINIITTGNNNPQGSIVRGTLQYGTNNSLIGSMKIEKQIRKVTLGISMNHHREDRAYTNYYNYGKREYVIRDSLKFLSSTPAARYPDTLLGIFRNAANVYFSYNPTSRIAVHAMAGWQHSQSQKIYADNQTTPITTNASDTRYLQLVADIHHLHTQVAYNGGDQNAVSLSGWEYDFNTLDAQAEYAFERKHLVIRPGISYRLAEYDDQKAIDKVGLRSAFIDGRKQINSTAAYVRSEFEKGMFRFIAALRAEKYNVPDKTYFSYQFAATCSPTESYILRLVHSRANRSSFILDSYYNQSFSFGTMSTTLLGNKNLSLMQLDMFEAGVRTKLGNGLLLDAELFMNYARDYAKLTLTDISDPNNTISMFQNMPMKANQYGITVNIDMVPASFFNVRTYATYQQTHVRDYATSTGTLENYLHRGSPDWYGGVVASVKFLKNCNLNLNPYFFSGYRIRTSKNTDHLWVPDCFLLNAKLDYLIAERTVVFVTARNLLSNNNPQVTWADPIGAKFLVGISMDF